MSDLPQPDTQPVPSEAPAPEIPLPTGPEETPAGSPPPDDGRPYDEGFSLPLQVRNFAAPPLVTGQV